LLDLQRSESDLSLITKKIELLKTELLKTTKISSIETGKIRKITEKSFKLVELRKMLHKVDKIEIKEQKVKEELIKKEQELIKDQNSPESKMGQYGSCKKCQQPNTGKD